jgi:Predicted nucleoside-diphosphate-sugar epimerases
MTGRVAPMTDTLFLISGASGRVGRHLVTQLIESGHRMRALTRSPEKADLPAAAEVVTGSFDHLPEKIFDGVTAAFVFPADGAADFARAAAASGVRHLVLLSSLAAALEHARDHGSASQRHHSAIEEAVRTSGAEWTILRPGTFASNLLAWSQPIRFTGGVRGPYPTSAQAPIHEADVAAAAAAVLTQPGHAGRIYPMTGPEALTRVEQLQTIAEAIGRELTFTEQSPEEFAAEMARYGVSADIVTMLLHYWSDTVTEPDVPRPPDALIGRPAKTLAEWARDHAADFGG